MSQMLSSDRKAMPWFQSWKNKEKEGVKQINPEIPSQKIPISDSGKQQDFFEGGGSKRVALSESGFP